MKFAEAIGAPLFNGNRWTNTMLIQSETLNKFQCKTLTLFISNKRATSVPILVTAYSYKKNTAIYRIFLQAGIRNLDLLTFWSRLLISLVDGDGLRTHFSDPMRTLRSSGYILSGIYLHHTAYKSIGFGWCAHPRKKVVLAAFLIVIHQTIIYRLFSMISSCSLLI